MLNIFVILILTVLFLVLAMWVVKRFTEELGPFFVKFLTTVLVVIAVVVVVWCVLALFGIGAANFPRIVR